MVRGKMRNVSVESFVKKKLRRDLQKENELKESLNEEN